MVVATAMVAEAVRRPTTFLFDLDGMCKVIGSQVLQSTSQVLWPGFVQGCDHVDVICRVN